MHQGITLIPEKKLIGKHSTMSFAENTTAALWKSFMPLRNEITNPVSSDLISMQLFENDFDFSNFNPHARFVKWAAVEVSDFTSVPAGLETFTIPGGMYAVFLHKGASQTAPQTFSYIFGTWLPNSGYVIDHRPHFEVLGDLYKNNDPASEEDIWIPVRPA